MGWLHRKRLRSWTAAAGFALACTIACSTACSTTYSWQASVAVTRPLAGSCVEAVLEGQGDVFDIVPTGAGAYAVRLEIPGVERADAPALAVTQSRDLDGEPILQVSTGYQTGLFENADANRILLQRAGELAVQLTEACTGQPVELGITHPCGRGQDTDLCVRGESR